MAVVTAALIAGGAGLVGGLMGDATSMMGQSGTNAANLQIAQMNNAFNAQQAALNRSFQANQAATAEQTRVADLKAAGLNPLLAAGNPATAMPGSTASSAGNPQMQNPMASFSQLGQQAASAAQAGAQAGLATQQASLAAAQTKKTISETPSGSSGLDSDGNPVVTVGENHDLGDANVRAITAAAGVSEAQANQVKANTDYIASQIKNADAQTAATNIQALLAGQNLEVLRATKTYLIQQAAASGAAAKNLGNVETGPMGPALAIINAILRPVSSAAGAAQVLK